MGRKVEADGEGLSRPNLLWGEAVATERGAANASMDSSTRYVSH